MITYLHLSYQNDSYGFLNKLHFLLLLLLGIHCHGSGAVAG